MTVTAAGCKTPGTVRYTCTACGTAKTSELPATGVHLYGSWQNAGDSHKHVCSDCGAEESGSHTFNGGEVTTAPTCVAQGVKTYTCTGCGAQKQETLAMTTTHAFGAWQIDGTTHSRTCPHCGKAESGAHILDAGAVTTKPTCKDEGAMTYTCTTCGTKFVEALAKLTTHTYDHDCDKDCNVCGATRETEHKFNTAWSKDAKGHWHVCKVCGEKKDQGAHYPGPAATEEKAQTCLTCGYVLTAKLNHSHKYAKELTGDETGHWYACEGCDEQKDFKAHRFDDACDPDCNDCGYKTANAHSYQGDWSYDETGHWGTCSRCGQESEVLPHDLDNDACKSCSYTVTVPTEHTHAYGETWLNDEVNHWLSCECGQLSEPESHTWDEGKEGQQDTMVYTCTQCGAEKTELVVPDGPGFPWWIVFMVIAIVCAIAAAVILVILLKPKKGSGKFVK